MIWMPCVKLEVEMSIDLVQPAQWVGKVGRKAKEEKDECSVFTPRGDRACYVPERHTKMTREKSAFSITLAEYINRAYKHGR